MPDIKIRLNHVLANGNPIHMYPITNPVSVEIDPEEYDTLPEGSDIESLDDLISNLGDLAFEDGIEIPDATTEVAGVVKLSHAINDTTNEAQEIAASSYAVGMLNAKVDRLRTDFEDFKETVEAIIDSLYGVTTETDEEGNIITNYTNGFRIGGVIVLSNVLDGSGNNTLDIRVSNAGTLIDFQDGMVIGDLVLRAVYDENTQDYVLDIDEYDGVSKVSVVYPNGVKIGNIMIKSAYNSTTDEYTLDVTADA